MHSKLGLRARRIPIVPIGIRIAVYGSSFEKTTSLACVVFFIIEWILICKIMKQYYFTGRWFTGYLKVFVVFTTIGVVYGMIVYTILLVKFTHRSFAIANIFLGLLIGSPLLMSTYESITKQGIEKWKKIKQRTPYHWNIRQYISDSESIMQYRILQLEVDHCAFPTHLELLVQQWVMLGLISPSIAIQPSKRSRYLGLLGVNTFTDSARFSEYSITATSINFTVATEGKLIADDLISGKARAKCVEVLQQVGCNVRAMSYDSLTRKICIQLYSGNEELTPTIAELLHSIERGYTVLEIKNNKNEYPIFSEYEIIDQHPISKLIYTIKCCYHLPKGLSPDLLSKHKILNLNAYVRLPVYEHTLKPYEDTLELYIQINQRDLSILSYLDFPMSQSLRVPVGFDLKYRKPVYANFDESTIQEGDHGFAPHYIIAGSTGSGKSSFIKYFITQLLRSHTPDTLRLFLVDPKVVSFSIFKELPHLYAPIVSHADKVSRVLSGIIKQVDERYQLLAKHGVENILQLRERFPELCIPTIIIIIDEFADIIDSHEYKNQESIVLQLKRIGQKARAAGVHCILMTQRATSTNIDGEIKANFAGRIAFKVAGEGDSHIMVGTPNAAMIQRPGESYAILGNSDEVTHMQVPYVSDSSIKQQIQKFSDIPLQYCDTTLSQDLLRNPLNPKELTLESLGLPRFPCIPIGIDLNTHEIYSLRFARSEGDDSEPTPHSIIAGATNSGKSQFAKVLITQLMRSGTPDEVKLILVDPKVVSFSYFNDMPHLYQPVVTNYEDLLPALEGVLIIIQERYKRFAQYEVENITQRNLEQPEKIYSLILIIDEFADLLDAYDYSGRDRIEKILKRFGQMARAAGVYMVLITQRANSTNIPGEIRTHFSGRIGFRMNTEADSYYLLESDGAEKIPSAGHFLIKTPITEIASGYVPILSKEHLQAFKKYTELVYL